MQRGKILDIGIKQAKAKQTRKPGKSVTKAVSEKQMQTVQNNIDRSAISAEPPAKLERKFTIRSKVQSIRDDFLIAGEFAMSMEFCHIPSGTFRMGRLGNFYRVTLSKGFYLGKYPVTQDQWETVMGNNPSDFKGTKYPVEQVSWDDCQEFVRRLNEMTGQSKYRLPTEAEWEYACRAGSNTNYPFGDDKKRLSEFGWYHANSGGVSHPVGGKLPNAWGLHDMNGGVWEWCNDWYAPYPRWKAVDPQGPSSGVDRVLRGGSWLDGPKRCRSGFRSYFSPDFSCNFFGFRLARKA